MWVLIIPGNSAPIRVAAVQVWFKSGAHRDYLIGYKPGRGRQPVEVVKPRSFADAGVLTGCDLRNAADAATLEKLIRKHFVGDSAPK